MTKSKKYIIVGVIAFVINLILVGYLYVGTKKNSAGLESVKIVEQKAIITPHKKLAEFRLQADKKSITAGSVFTINIRLDSPDKLLGADAVITYDPEILVVNKVEAGDMFPNYPRILNEPERARIVITGVNINQTEPRGSLFAVIEFAGLKPGSSSIGFVHERSTEKSGSTAISADSGENILTNVEKLEILIQ